MLAGRDNETLNPKFMVSDLLDPLWVLKLKSLRPKYREASIKTWFCSVARACKGVFETIRWLVVALESVQSKRIRLG